MSRILLTIQISVVGVVGIPMALIRARLGIRVASLLLAHRGEEIVS